MITIDQLIEIGRFNQPHGIKGEINATITADLDPEQLDCIVLDIDGIFVPFFVNACRPKGRESVLLTLDDVADEKSAEAFRGKTIYVPADRYPDLAPEDDDDDPDGFYAEDLIGYSVLDPDGNAIGLITDVDDSTDNVLFVVTRVDGSQALIPVTDEYITDIDTTNDKITMDLPAGLLDI